MSIRTCPFPAGTECTPYTDQFKEGSMGAEVSGQYGLDCDPSMNRLPNDSLSLSGEFTVVNQYPSYTR